MDTGRGKFAEISEDLFEEATQKGLHGVFREGETVELRGSRFVIQKITYKTIKLMLLAK